MEKGGKNHLVKTIILVSLYRIQGGVLGMHDTETSSRNHNITGFG
jgi:hypothetical protein